MEYSAFNKNMLFIDLNCDMGEGMPNDHAIMPFISSANIACGYHAGSEKLIRETIELAQQNNVAIGAHPGFADKKNFGRIDMVMHDDGYYNLIMEQLWLFKKITDAWRYNTACKTTWRFIQYGC